MKIKYLENDRYIVYVPFRFFSEEFLVFSKKTRKKVTTIWAVHKGFNHLYLWDDKDTRNDIYCEDTRSGIKILLTFMKYL